MQLRIGQEVLVQIPGTPSEPGTVCDAIEWFRRDPHIVYVPVLTVAGVARVHNQHLSAA